MKKLSLIMVLLLVFASVSAMAEDTTTEEVFAYSVDFQTLSSYPEDGILSSNVYNYMSNGACYQKIGSSDGAGWGHSVAVGGMNSDITYAEAKVNAVWSAGFKIGFVPVGESEATEFIYFEPDMTSTSTNVTDEDGRLLATYARAKNNPWTIGMYTDSANDISHVYFGGKVIAANLDYDIDKIGRVQFYFSKIESGDLRPYTVNLKVTCDPEAIAALPKVASEYYQDFENGIPSDEYFSKGDGYSYISSGHFCTKVEDNNFGFGINTLGLSGSTTYSEIKIYPHSTLLFRIAGRNPWDSGDTSWITFDAANGDITDTAGNVIANASLAGKESVIGLLMDMNKQKVKLFIDGVKIADNIPWAVSSLSFMNYTWYIHENHNSGSRPYLDDVLVTSDLSKFPAISYYQDFNCAEMPSDAYFSYTGYNYLSNGALYTKVKNSVDDGAVLNLPNYGYEKLYSSVEATFKYNVSFKVKADDTVLVNFDGTDGVIYDAAGKKLADFDISTSGQIKRTISVYLYDTNKAAVFSDGVLIAANLDCPENISTISYKWSDLSGDDLRVSLDNIVVTQTEKSFGSDFGIGDVYFEENDTEITAHADVVNYTSSTFTASFVIASYNGNTLENVNVVPVSAPEKDITDVFVNLEKPSGSNITVKAMLVSDMSTLKPLVKAAAK